MIYWARDFLTRLKTAEIMVRFKEMGADNNYGISGRTSVGIPRRSEEKTIEKKIGASSYVLRCSQNSTGNNTDKLDGHPQESPIYGGMRDFCLD